MDLTDLAQFCREKIKTHPHLKLQIIDSYSLAQSEIEDFDESCSHEVELAMYSINELIEEDEK